MTIPGTGPRSTHPIALSIEMRPGPAKPIADATASVRGNFEAPACVPEPPRGVHGQDGVGHHRDDDDASERRQQAEHEEQARQRLGDPVHPRHHARRPVAKRVQHPGGTLRGRKTAVDGGVQAGWAG